MIILITMIIILCIVCLILSVNMANHLKSFNKKLTELENEKYQNSRIVFDIKENLNSLKEEIDLNNETLTKFLTFVASRDLELIKHLSDSLTDTIIRNINIYENDNINRFLVFVTNNQYIPKLKSKLLEKINPSYCSCDFNSNEKIECSFETATSLYYYGICTNSVVDRSRILNILKRTKFSQFKVINTFSSEIFRSLKDNKEIN